MNATFLSFDPGTENTGYAILEASIPPILTPTPKIILRDCGLIRTKKVTGGSSEVRERIDRIGGNVRDLIADANPDYLCIEDFTEQGKLVGKTYKEMSWLTEHLRMIGYETGIETAIYENGEWKYELTGARRLTKQQVQHYITHKLPEALPLLKGLPDHVWDAVAIGLAGIKRLYRTGAI